MAKESLMVQEFMELPDDEKYRYFLMDEDGNFFDFHINNFLDVPDERYLGDWECEECGESLTEGLGSTDIREPYFCRECFVKINESAIFIREDVLDKIIEAKK